ncbi:hypothetical protein [Paenibacillus sp. V4I5]|uniref:hypothetical protein n=1 Tax=Paenibacillus sp. V4I5 TaxID=3042306 RepID=UPI002790276B|nr:hypothetical protein [Paenibacillus sp. V4I5]MDQ0913846.1 hypothetical protein [Paenibacillus sp. V4I5]
MTMKFVLKIGIPFMLLLFMFFLVYQATLAWNPLAIQKKTVAFLNAIKTQEYREAERLFDGSIDKNTWVDEIQKLHEKEGFKLLAYENVKADYDDGTFGTGHSDLTIEVDGKPLKVMAILTFSSRGKPKQICAVHPSGTKPGSISEIVVWNQLVCGASF